MTPSRSNQARLKALGAAGVVVVGNTMLAIYGPKSEGYKMDMASMQTAHAQSKEKVV